MDSSAMIQGGQRIVWLDRIAALCIALSIGLTLSPRWYGVGLIWSLVTLAVLGALLWTDRGGKGQLMPAAATTLVLGLSLGQFMTDLVSLLWLGGAALLIYAFLQRIKTS